MLANAAGMMAKYLETSLARLNVVKAPRIESLTVRFGFLEEQDVPAALLRFMMLRGRSPSHHRLLIAPGRVGQDPSRTAAALETLVVDEAVDPFQDGSQLLGKIEVAIEGFAFGINLKNDREHLLLSSCLRLTGKDAPHPHALR